MTSVLVVDLLIDDDWPGNVRELQNCMERVMALGTLHVISADDLPANVRDFARATIAAVASASTAATGTATGQPDELITLDEVERRYIRHVLAATSNNKTDAARRRRAGRRAGRGILIRRRARPRATSAWRRAT